MTEIRINQNLCRLCGCKNENGQSLSNDQDDEGGNELLFKVQETFSMLVSVLGIRFFLRTYVCERVTQILSSQTCSIQ